MEDVAQRNNVAPLFTQSEHSLAVFPVAHRLVSFKRLFHVEHDSNEEQQHECTPLFLSNCAMFRVCLPLFARGSYSPKRAIVASPAVRKKMENPVASFVKEALDKHPQVRAAKLGTRLELISSMWAGLPLQKRLEYANEPLKGLRTDGGKYRGK